MLRPRPMTRMLIVASKDHLRTIVQELYAHRVFHIQDFVEGRDEEKLTIGTPLQEASEVSEKLVKVRSLEATFRIKGEDLVPAGKRSTAELRVAIDGNLVSLETQVNETLTQIAQTDTAIRETEQYMAEVAPFALVSIPLELYRGYETLSVFTGKIPHDVTIPVSHEKVYVSSKEGSFFAVFVQKKDREEIQKILESHQ
ncbi:MAG: V-type ATP synthase subunit I, partial [Methanomicrobiales archaeon]|nr:V-type ATP synthase subunit I [Methanomicrobiales archaeon]